MSDKLSDERDSIEYAIQVLRQVEAGDGTFVGQCADAIEGLEALLAASPAPAITMPPLNDAMRAVLTNENCIYGTPDELYAALVRAAQAISESEDARNAARYRHLRAYYTRVVFMQEDGPSVDIQAISEIGDTFEMQALDAAIDAARAGGKS
ncbi:hypothetical protein [Burkholderia gladioli]|uniref:hypothetical protein n=1 Tax=Burkholderia gladioli TaxID=28095 RepID=UPI00163FB660|nr:hypothetical protein [Burkholderia gladioli]